MSRVDGFYIVADKTCIVDSQGPIYEGTSPERLGGSFYEIDWTDPCGRKNGTCDSTSATWSPTVTNQWSLSVADISTAEGGGNDEYFRNSGIVVKDGAFYGVNGVHPADGSLTGSYTKSIAKVDMATPEMVESWPLYRTTIGRDADMEGLSCGPDQCATSIFIGDECNVIYRMDLMSGVVTDEWLLMHGVYAVLQTSITQIRVLKS